MGDQKLIVFLLFVTIAFGALFVWFFGRNVERLEPKVAVIDSVLMKETAFCFKAHEKVAKMLDNVLTRVRKFEQKMKVEYEKIRNDKNISEKQKIKSIAKIEMNCSEVSQKYQLEMQEIRNIDQKLSVYLTEKLNQIIVNIAKSKDIDVVLNKELNGAVVVFYNSKQVDITQLVIQKLNEIVPDVSLEDLR